MNDCGGQKNNCDQPDRLCCSGRENPLDYFDNMICNCLEYAETSKKQGKPIIAIMCEYTPREIIIAAGGVPVCLCGGSAQTIPAAEKYLPPNLCPLIKSTYGYHVTGKNPFMEMADLIVAETTCDGKKKMYELLSRDRPMYVIELPQKPLEKDAFDYWLRQLVKFKDYMQERFRVIVTDDKMREAIRIMNRERKLRRELANLMKSSTPPLTGLELLKLKSSISGINRDLKQYVGIADYLRKQNPESKQNRIRVLLTGVPLVYGAERVMEIIESSGGLVVCAENCTGIKPIAEDVDENKDALVAIAEKYMNIPCSVMTPNKRRIEMLNSLIAEYRPECIIDLVWQNCLTYDVESYLIRNEVAQKASLPCLKIATDYSPSDSERIALRVQALMETAKNRRSLCTRQE